MSEKLWGKDIIKARSYIDAKKYSKAKIILEGLLEVNNEACVIDAKKLLVNISLAEKTNLELSAKYCKDILNYQQDIKYIQYFIELNRLVSNLDESIDFILNIKDKMDAASRIKINLQLIESIVFEKKKTDNLVNQLLEEIISDYKQVETLDDNFLLIRKYPSFSTFIDLLKEIESMVSSFKVESFIKDNLSWIDETGKQILKEKGFNEINV